MLFRPPTNDFSQILRARREARTRRGALYLAELILVMPVFMIMLLAAVQFGMFFVNLQAVSFASRVGAVAASESNGNFASIDTAVEQQLAANGIDDYCIQVQSSVPDAVTEMCDCEPKDFEAPLPPYFRVNVCVEQMKLMPNLLKPFGYDIEGKTVVCATVMHGEDEP